MFGPDKSNDFLTEEAQAVARRIVSKGGQVPGEYDIVYDKRTEKIGAVPRGESYLWKDPTHPMPENAVTGKLRGDVINAVQPSEDAFKGFDSSDSGVRRAKVTVEGMLNSGHAVRPQDLRAATAGLTKEQRAELTEVVLPGLKRQYGADLLPDSTIFAVSNEQTRRYVRTQGGETMFRAKKIGAVPQDVKDRARQARVDISGMDAVTAERTVSMAEKEREGASKTQVSDLRNLGKEARKGNVGQMADLIGPGLGDTKVEKLERSGFTIAKLNAGVKYDDLDKIKGFGPGAIQALKDRGFTILPSEKTKRPVGRPAKGTFGSGRNPFMTAPSKPLFGTRTVIAAGEGGNLQQRKVTSRFSEAMEEFGEAFRGTVGRPFGLWSEYRESEPRKAVKQANQLAKLKRAQFYRQKVEKANSGWRLSLARIGFETQTKVLGLFVLALTLGLLFVPLGILQYAGWVLFGIVAFIFNGVYLVGLTGINFVVTGMLNAINSLGFVLQGSMQTFVDALPQYIPGAGSGANALRAYAPINQEWTIAQVLNPNIFFPDCVNSNSLGSAGLHLLALGLVGAGAWIGAHAPLAVGIAVAVFLGVPAFYVNKAAGFTVFALAGMLMLVPGDSGLSVPTWVLAAVVAAVLLGVLATMMGGMIRDSGVVGAVVAGGIGVMVLLIGVIVYDSFIGGPVAAGVASAATAPVGFDWSRSIALGVAPLGNLLSTMTSGIAGGADNVANLVTTGWAHALDPGNFVGLRDSFNLGTQASAASAVKAAAKCASGG